MIAQSIVSILDLRRGVSGHRARIGPAIVDTVLVGGLLIAGATLDGRGGAEASVRSGLVVVAGLIRTGGPPFRLLQDHVACRGSAGVSSAWLASMHGPVIVLHGTNGAHPAWAESVGGIWAITGFHHAVMLVSDVRRVVTPTGAPAH